MIIGWIIWAIVLAIDLYTDTRPQIKVNHTRGAIIRVVGLLPAFYFVHNVYGILLMLSAYWILFDGLWNVIKGLPWFRIGETSKLDQWQRKYPAITVVKYLVFPYLLIFYLI